MYDEKDIKIVDIARKQFNILIQNKSQCKRLPFYVGDLIFVRDEYFSGNQSICVYKESVLIGKVIVKPKGYLEITLINTTSSDRIETIDLCNSKEIGVHDLAIVINHFIKHSKELCMNVDKEKRFGEVLKFKLGIKQITPERFAELLAVKVHVVHDILGGNISITDIISLRKVNEWLGLTPGHLTAVYENIGKVDLSKVVLETNKPNRITKIRMSRTLTGVNIVLDRRVTPEPEPSTKPKTVLDHLDSILDIPEFRQFIDYAAVSKAKESLPEIARYVVVPTELLQSLADIACEHDYPIAGDAIEILDRHNKSYSKGE